MDRFLARACHDTQVEIVKVLIRNHGGVELEDKIVTTLLNAGAKCEQGLHHVLDK